MSNCVTPLIKVFQDHLRPIMQRLDIFFPLPLVKGFNPETRRLQIAGSKVPSLNNKIHFTKGVNHKTQQEIL